MASKPTKSHWENPLGLAVRHDKARARAAKLRAEADRLDAKADELERQYDDFWRPKGECPEC